MDLYHHSNPPFTSWIINSGLLHEKFVVVDIGCQGGEHPRWSFLKDKVEFYGFDPIKEAIDTLRRQAKSGRTYYEYALGNEDGERQFFVSNNTFSSSFFGQREELLNGYPEITRGARAVTIRRLDSLFKEQKLLQADYIKLDCEGFEPEVLRGGREYLHTSAPICVTSETGFHISPTYPHSHFHAVNEILAEHRLLVFDINIVRAARPPYQAARAAVPWGEPDPFMEIPHLDVGAPGTLDVVFCRDFVAEATEPSRYSFAQIPGAAPKVDQLIKAMINFELHGLMDCAYHIAMHFRDLLQTRLDINKTAELLLIRPPHARNTADVVNCLSMIAQLRSRFAEAQSEKCARGAVVSEVKPTYSPAKPVAAIDPNPLRQVGGWELLRELRHRFGRRLSLRV
jgi:FkbM family methyltransferase